MVAIRNGSYIMYHNIQSHVYARFGSGETTPPGFIWACIGDRVLGSAGSCGFGDREFGFVRGERGSR